MQFEKFQGFAAQLTKEASELKTKIEQHKKENARLHKLVEQRKTESDNLNVRLAGTEKQRDDALEALIMQQEVAEDLERERKKNKKELSELIRHNHNIMRQRDEAQRVVIHLRALIEGQAQHVEHLVRSLADTDTEDIAEEDESNGQVTARQSPMMSRRASRASSRSSSRTASRASTIDPSGLDAEDFTPVLERRLANSPSMKRFSQMSWSDVADRNIRDKTDAIADIIRNISEQCAAAVEGLHMAQAAAAQEEDAIRSGSDCDDDDDDDDRDDSTRRRRSSTIDSTSMLSPNSVPPTPDLTYRSSTALSMSSMLTPERGSLTYGELDVPTKIVEAEDGIMEYERESTYLDVVASRDNKLRNSDGSIMNRAGARVSAFGTP
jgi:uncharacterized protein YhaN